MSGIKYYQLAEDEDLPDEFCAIRNTGGEPTEYTFYRQEAENDKLRELCGDMWRFMGAACKKYPRLFDPAAQGGQMVQLNAIDAFEQRMSELGIEVAGC